MNTNEANTQLEQLFHQARESEPQFNDPQFTAGVLKHMAIPTQLELSAESRSSLLMDVVTAGLGVVALSYFIDLQQVFAFLIELVPESVSISPMAVIASLAGMTALSVASWWTIEQR